MYTERKLLIKNMVCDRCIAVLATCFSELGVQVKHIQLGIVIIDAQAVLPDKNELIAFLHQFGFDLVADRKLDLVNQIKQIIDEGLRLQMDAGNAIKFSKLLTGRLYLNYDAISSLFESREGITIEKYTIQRRLQRVRELLQTTSRSLTDIAYSVGYSSVAHLSRQFHETLGIRASEFRARAGTGTFV
jgi:AraC-like DNA-binding protein